MAKEQMQQELIALLEKSGDAKTKIIDKQSEKITFLKSHIQTLGILLDEYDDIVQKYINQKIVKNEIEIDKEELEKDTQTENQIEQEQINKF
jgi:hypothetical protein